ncbi:hypothetical protein ACI2LJ_00545 [Streptomyces sp. NPDC088090]|uniref:hypothetical protein n=1 Tax=Streptomyces sp. NPDC088090 TaxID=3365822 RepID=UPI00384C1D7F
MGLLEGEPGPRAFADPVPEGVWFAFLRFGRQLFHVPDAPDADGLLFPYGTSAFDGPATFTPGLTRQFEVSGSDGDHDHWVQVHCELRYGPTPALDAPGSFPSWFFHDAGADLEEWARALTGQAVRTTIRELEPTGIRVYPERV